jgi:hypothetical protein
MYGISADARDARPTRSRVRRVIIRRPRYDNRALLDKESRLENRDRVACGEWAAEPPLAAIREVAHAGQGVQHRKIATESRAKWGRRNHRRPRYENRARALCTESLSRAAQFPLPSLTLSAALFCEDAAVHRIPVYGRHSVEYTLHQPTPGAGATRSRGAGTFYLAKKYIARKIDFAIGTYGLFIRRS